LYLKLEPNLGLELRARTWALNTEVRNSANATAQRVQARGPK